MRCRSSPEGRYTRSGTVSAALDLGAFLAAETPAGPPVGIAALACTVASLLDKMNELTLWIVEHDRWMLTTSGHGTRRDDGDASLHAVCLAVRGDTMRLAFKTTGRDSHLNAGWSC
jgi:hypothetical protein